MKLFFNLFLLLSIFFISDFILPQNYNSIQLKNEALSLMNNARYGEAIDLLNKYIAENPQREDGFNLRGLCYEKRGNYEFAVYDFRTAKKISPNNKEITSNLNRATQDWYKLLYNKIEGHKREIAKNPNSTINYLEIGKCYKNLGEWKEAEIWYDEYLEKEVASADEILRYTEILAQLNHIAKGEPILKSYVEKYPTDHRLWSRYGYFQLWMGKNKQAIETFSKSLEIRPYFKEALDGLDLAKGKGYVYSINDTTTGFNYGLPPAPKEYIIDKYYRQLKTNPNNDELRFKLTEELIKAKRFEEANDQLVILSNSYSKDDRYLTLLNTTTSLRKSYYADKIRYYEDILSKNPKDKKALLELGKFHSYNKDYELALKYLRQYLLLNPDDLGVQYNVVEILMWQSKLCEAQIEIGKLLKKDPDNPKFNLMFGKINFWLDQNLNEAENAYNKVLVKDSNNVEALIGLSYIQLRKENFDQAEIHIKKLESINNSIPELPLLKKSLTNLELNLQDQKRYKMLDKARSYVKDNDYDNAIELFNNYLIEDKFNVNVNKELADTYLLNNDYNNAIKVYNEILKLNYDYEIDKQRAKIIYWYGDSTLAVKEFRRLSQKNPDDIETKLFLGDAYLKAGQTQNAKIVYEELLSTSPNSHILKTRLNWAGGSGRYALESFPTYIQLIPKGSYFVDNTDFELSNIGLGLEMGATKNIALGISGSQGNLKSATETLRYSAIKGTAYFKLTETISASASFGRSFFADENEENIIEVNLSAQKKNVYQFIASLNFSDAVFILYSPFLVTTRLNSYYYNFFGNYKLKNKIILNGRYAYVDVSDGNAGNLLQLRIGKEFEEDFSAGYEYYYYYFKNFTQLYWSPDNFESHSIWADWYLFKEGTADLSIGGKVGLIPQNDYILSEFYASFNYPITGSLFFNAKFVTSNSSRSNVGYRSNSFLASLFWNL